MFLTQLIFPEPVNTILHGNAAPTGGVRIRRQHGDTRAAEEWEHVLRSIRGALSWAVLRRSEVSAGILGEEGRSESSFASTNNNGLSLASEHLSNSGFSKLVFVKY